MSIIFQSILGRRLVCLKSQKADANKAIPLTAPVRTLLQKAAGNSSPPRSQPATFHGMPQQIADVRQKNT